MSSGPTTSATAKPATSRLRLSAPPSFGGARSAEPAAACVTMCTSMSPDSRMTVAPMPGPVNAAASRDRRLTPMTSCVAFTARAKSTSARGTSSPTTWWNVPPSYSTSVRCSVEGAGCRARRPSGFVTCTASSSPPAERDGDARAAPQERLALGPAGEGDDHALARLPLAVDAVLGPVELERAVDLVGEPEQRELAQRGEVAEPEVVRERGIDPLGRVDEPAREPVAQRLRREVDDLDLVGGAQHGIGDRLALRRRR